MVKPVSESTLKKVLTENLSKSAKLMTDELPVYKNIEKQFASHEVVTHKNYEYVRGNVTTNTVEGYFGLLKRGINGIYHHVSREHLHRYLAEFDFRYNHRKIDDNEKTISAIAGFERKRLIYWDSLNKRETKKITNDKPISLYPLKPEEAIKKLLQTQPEKKKRSTWK